MGKFSCRLAGGGEKVRPPVACRPPGWLKVKPPAAQLPARVGGGEGEKLGHWWPNFPLPGGRKVMPPAAELFAEGGTGGRGES
jgi:hypothetical protein